MSKTMSEIADELGRWLSDDNNVGKEWYGHNFDRFERRLTIMACDWLHDAVVNNPDDDLFDARLDFCEHMGWNNGADVLDWFSNNPRASDYVDDYTSDFYYFSDNNDLDGTGIIYQLMSGGIYVEATYAWNAVEDAVSKVYNERNKESSNA